jgi:hypothetical protein
VLRADLGDARHMGTTGLLKFLSHSAKKISKPAGVAEKSRRAGPSPVFL